MQHEYRSQKEVCVDTKQGQVKNGKISTLLNKIRKYVEGYATIALAYRTLRDAWALQRQTKRPHVTPHGFKLMGNSPMQAGTFEPEETAMIKHLLKSVDVFVDVGANIGFYTCLGRSQGKETIAIEPLPQNNAYLYANLNANGFTDIEVYPVALAQQPGLASLYGVGTGASLVRGWAGTSPSFQRTVPLLTLDIVLGERFDKKKLLIKVDVEGGEYEVLQGAGSTLSLSPSPIWIMEIGLTEHHPVGLNPNYARTFEIFWQHGYRAWAADLARKAVTPADVEQWVKMGKCGVRTYNYLFAKA